MIGKQRPLDQQLANALQRCNAIQAELDAERAARADVVEIIRWAAVTLRTGLYVCSGPVVVERLEKAIKRL